MRTGLISVWSSVCGYHAMLLSNIFVSVTNAPKEFMIADVSQMKMKYFPSGILLQHSTQPSRKHTDGERTLNVLQGQHVQQRHVLCPI
jgi:hypothetical protein